MNNFLLLVSLIIFNGNGISCTYIYFKLWNQKYETKKTNVWHKCFFFFEPRCISFYMYDKLRIQNKKVIVRTHSWYVP